MVLFFLLCAVCASFGHGQVLFLYQTFSPPPFGGNVTLPTCDVGRPGTRSCRLLPGACNRCYVYENDEVFRGLTVSVSGGNVTLTKYLDSSACSGTPLAGPCTLMVNRCNPPQTLDPDGPVCPLFPYDNVNWRFPNIYFVTSAAVRVQAAALLLVAALWSLN